MLVLTRKRNEKISIGPDVVIRIIQLTKTTVRIGIEAPPAVKVRRGELANGKANLPIDEIDLEPPLKLSSFKAVFV